MKRKYIENNGQIGIDFEHANATENAVALAAEEEAKIAQTNKEFHRFCYIAALMFILTQMIFA